MSNNIFLYTTLAVLGVCTIYNLYWFKEETEKLNLLFQQYDKNVEQYNKNVEQHNRNVEQHNKNYKELHTNLKNLHSNAYKLTNDLRRTRDVIQQLYDKIDDENKEELPSFQLENDTLSCDSFSVISCDIDKYQFATKPEIVERHWLFSIF
jgi:septal ring factor EnvC (AmiA/AmiB activator)